MNKDLKHPTSIKSVYGRGWWLYPLSPIFLLFGFVLITILFKLII